MLKTCIQQLMQGNDLTALQCQEALEEIISGANKEQVAAFLVLLHAKGETPEELQGIVQGMRDVMNKVSFDGALLDVVGTGGDNANTVNISTASAILAAACGVNVVKHGNRSVSSQCGSADLLEALDFKLDRTSEQVAGDIRKLGFAFCFAPNFHPAMKAIKTVRERLGVRTTFNLLGPLLNPANANCYLMGVFSEDYLDLLADTLIRLKVKHAIVVHSCGLDELSLLGPSVLVEIKNGKKERYTLDPKEFGFERCQLKDIQGGNAEKNKSLLLSAFSGKEGPIADTILLNTGAALYVANHASTIKEGIDMARKALKEGAALKFIERFKAQAK